MSAWLPDHFIGGSSGEPFRIFGGNSGRFVRTIRVHFNTDNLVGIAVTWNDGTNSPQIGSAEHTLRSITLREEERVLRASLWGNGSGSRAGRISLHTSGGQSLNAGPFTFGEQEFSIDVGSGHLGGFAGYHEDEINSLGFIFLCPISSVEIGDVQHDPFPPTTLILPLTVTHKPLSERHRVDMCQQCR